jgi:ABC-type Mn2+/Zn2+ transport system ATPase subunit
VLMGRLKPKRIFNRYSAQDYLIATQCLNQVKMGDFAKRQIGKLSGGQQQRVFIARALARNADIYLLDEPFAGVDVVSEQTIIELLHTLRNEGKTIIVVHHDLSSVEKYFDYLVMIANGQAIAGKVSEVFNQQNLRLTYSNYQQ